MTKTPPRTSVPLSPHLRQEAERRMEQDGIRSLGAFMEIALRHYLAASPGASVGTGGGSGSDAHLATAIEEHTAELKKAIPVLVAVALGFRELQDQFDDITVAIGRRRGAAHALEEIQAKGRG